MVSLFLFLFLSLYLMFQGNSEEFYTFVPLAGAAQPGRPASAGKLECQRFPDAPNVIRAQCLNRTKLYPNVKRQNADLSPRMFFKVDLKPRGAGLSTAFHQISRRADVHLKPDDAYGLFKRTGARKASEGINGVLVFPPYYRIPVVNISPIYANHILIYPRVVIRQRKRSAFLLTPDWIHIAL